MELLRFLLLCILIAAYFYPSIQEDLQLPIIETDTIRLNKNCTIFYDPPYNHSSPTALGVFVWSNLPNVKIYYARGKDLPNINSSYADVNQPYIQLDTGFKAPREVILTLVGVYEGENGLMYRSNQISVQYFVEAAARPYSYGYLIPGIESSGDFIQFQLEVAASARAQAAGSQEFADFFTNLGIGVYGIQIQALKLTRIDPDLNGFEGGFPFNLTKTKHYGILIPFFNGKAFYGKVVKIDLQAMNDPTTCQKKYAIEKRLTNGTIKITGTYKDYPQLACVHVLDLTSLHPKAKGFRRGFVGFPYGYLSAGEYSAVVRLDLLNYGLATTKVIDLSLINPTYGGYSGGFSDGLWSCYTPYRTFTGEIGGVQSTRPVDANNLRPYFSSIMVCVGGSAWGLTAANDIAPHIKTIDFSLIEQNLRGFSDSIRIGRYAYLSPLTHGENQYSSKLIRVTLGYNNIGAAIDAAVAANNIRGIVNILDLSQISEALAGYSGVFTAGQYLYLVPYRNRYLPSNGQRGHGNFVRLNMNQFNIYGVDYLDLSTTKRNQIPSFADVNLRGFSYGFASGQYCILVPFYNADFNGKIARFSNLKPLADDLQELDLLVGPVLGVNNRTYKGYRGGFVSLWQGVDR